ncbi:hypothetical protein D7B24_008230 [Verticillium nonalfalfae]|uniref:Uncharacterized protein n=1 Tax=Verticillium nonalfalfae TaxID=1051616 RepID=A0A3M9Y6B0_9PEZI|nr:uncharacterized protein D7B24_008230 [Verticillium nonalfalfae]RNJ55705.1 hypothetical protein D7B24_008230 [Verticillium nonalfalfae]
MWNKKIQTPSYTLTDGHFSGVTEINHTVLEMIAAVSYQTDHPVPVGYQSSGVDWTVIWT